MSRFSDKKKSAKKSRNSKLMHADRQSAQQPPRKEVMEVMEEMIKKHQADLEYLKDK